MSNFAAQLQSFIVAGSGQVIGDTQMTFTQMLTIGVGGAVGVPLTMASLGTVCYMTIEPNTVNEEQIQFTGLTQNSNGTATITGVSNVSFQTPYTVTSGFLTTHAGGVTAIISNTAGFYSNFASTIDAETVSGLWTFTTSPIVPTPTTASQAANKSYVDNIAIAGAPNASTTVKGIGLVSYTPVSPTSPVFLGQNDPVLTTGAGLTTNSGVALNGSTNKIEDTSDTSATSSANKLVRANSSGLIDASFLSSVTAAQVFTSQIAATAITAGQPLTAWYYQSDGGITLDAKLITTLSNASASQSVTFTTGSGANRAMVVFVSTLSSGAQTVSSITYNSVALTLIDTNTNNNNHVYTYLLPAPSSGSHTLAVTFSSGSIYGAIDIRTYNNVNQSTTPDAHAAVNANNTIVSNALSTVANGALIVAGGAGSASNPTVNITAITNAANNFETTNTISGVQASAASGDTGMIYPAAQSITHTVNAGGSGTAYTYLNQISLAPATAPVTGVTPSSSATIGYGQNKYSAFLGFAASSVSAGAPVNVITNGVITTSGLTPNTQYYLNDTVGTIGTSAGTNSRKVGISIASTQLLVTNTW